MIVLAVETSGENSSIALQLPGGDIVESSLTHQGRGHARSLVPDVDRLLAVHRLLPAQVDVVAVSIGPGSFTGLRVGAVFAKVFAWINSARLVAVDTLRVIAQQAPKDLDRVTAVVNAQRNQVFAADYQWDSHRRIRQAVSSVQIVNPEQLLDIGRPTEQRMLTGPGLEKHHDRLVEQQYIVPDSCWNPRAATVAELAAWMSAGGEYSDPILLEPVYIRRSYAEEREPDGM